MIIITPYIGQVSLMDFAVYVFARSVQKISGRHSFVSLVYRHKGLLLALDLGRFIYYLPVKGYHLLTINVVIDHIVILKGQLDVLIFMQNISYYESGIDG